MMMRTIIIIIIIIIIIMIKNIRGSSGSDSRTIVALIDPLKNPHTLLSASINLVVYLRFLNPCRF